MAKQVDPFTLEFNPGEYSIEIPEDHKFTRSPEELMELMGECAYRYREASKILNAMEASKTLREKKTSIIIDSRSSHLIQNSALRRHLEVCIADTKFKWTLDVKANFIYLEHQLFMEKYHYYEKVASRAKEEHEMWSKQLMQYQSKNKLKVAEMTTL